MLMFVHVWLGPLLILDAPPVSALAGEPPNGICNNGGLGAPGDYKGYADYWKSQNLKGDSDFGTMEMWASRVV
jgi:hypothetical protein